MPVSSWRTMESAPKGGGAPLWIDPPRILLLFSDGNVSVAYWDWYYADATDGQSWGFIGGKGCTDGFAWVEPCSAEPLNLHYEEPVVGWMPLPI